MSLTDLTSMTHEASRSGSCSIPANLNNKSDLELLLGALRLWPEHPFDNLHDLFRIYRAATISIKGCEDPVELLLDGLHVLHVRGLEPLEEVEGAAVILVKHSEESIIENIILKCLACQNWTLWKYYFCWWNVAFTCDASFGIFSVKFVIGLGNFLKNQVNNKLWLTFLISNKWKCILIKVCHFTVN